MKKSKIRKAGQQRPDRLRVFYAQGLRSEASPKKWSQAGLAAVNVKFREALRPEWAKGFAADFFGANSVASALGIRYGRDPATDRC